MCFNFLTHRTKILKLSRPTNVTFAVAPTHEANPSAKSKEPVFLPTHGQTTKHKKVNLARK